MRLLTFVPKIHFSGVLWPSSPLKWTLRGMEEGATITWKKVVHRGRYYFSAPWTWCLFLYQFLYRKLISTLLYKALPTDVKPLFTFLIYIFDPFHAEGYSACPKEHSTKMNLRQLRRMGSGDRERCFAKTSFVTPYLFLPSPPSCKAFTSS